MDELMHNALAWDILDRRRGSTPDKDFLRSKEGATSYGQLAVRAADYAAKLARIGVARGDLVPTFLSEVSCAVATWFGLMRLGAVWAPINTEFRGVQLVNALNLMRAPVLIVDKRYLETILGVLPSLEHVRRVIVHDDAEVPAPQGEVTFLHWDDLESGTAPPIASVARSDVAMIQFTSGSTGVSKAVQLSHGYLVGQARLAARCFDLRPDDVVYCPFPLHHWDASIGTVMGSLVTGATAALAGRFSASGFWDDIRAYGATMFDFMGATLTFLFERPPSPRDREHRVRLAWGLPMPEFRAAFEARFGFPLLEGYGSTEGGVCVFQTLGERYPKGSCGRTRPEYRLKLIDESGSEAPVGHVGEILTKPDDPCLMMNGYLNMPEINAELIRDGWYHSGDLGRLDEAGNLYFVGRKKDVIRRRGENISAFEIERELANHPDVSEAAAVGIPSPFTEEDVAVAVVLRAGATLSAEELRSYCAGRMARYMVPERVLFVARLPKTPSEKVAKAELRKLFAAESAESAQNAHE
jgi:crotonobetaine/carnitine-CoA ligase